MCSDKLLIEIIDLQPMSGQATRLKKHSSSCSIISFSPRIVAQPRSKLAHLKRMVLDFRSSSVILQYSLEIPLPQRQLVSLYELILERSHKSASGNLMQSSQIWWFDKHLYQRYFPTRTPVLHRWHCRRSFKISEVWLRSPEVDIFFRFSDNFRFPNSFVYFQVDWEDCKLTLFECNQS